ncbi:MAG: sugar transferase [Bacteroidetes bacterium]|nr:sugar transferase [Bacteroidota bacterium]MBS1774864.1 sugar transferase [Bacteroidota bacterium]
MRLPKEKRQAIQQLALLDYSSAFIAWLLFFPYRQQLLGYAAFLDAWKLMTLKDWTIALFLVPGCWLFLYLLSGSYFDLYRKSRLNEINRTLTSCIAGTILIALFAFANDANDYSYFIKMTGRYLLIHTSLTLLFRILLLNRIKQNILKGKVGFNTVIIGGNDKAISLYKQLTESKKTLGNIFKGYVNTEIENTNGMSAFLPQLGRMENIGRIIDRYQVEEVIVAVDSSEHNVLENILTRLSYQPVVVKVLPDLYDIISGSVKTSNVYDAVLIHIPPNLMPDWQRVFKRTIDITVSSLAMILLLPLYLLAALKVRFSSKGPIFYKQQRIGRYGKAFNIYKFRSMYVNAEEKGPALSSDDDPRITQWGKVMRKWRIDEIPQFYNILIGDMSLVGPRPERRYFIDIISKTHPHYRYLHKVKPGLTSWGMVQFGYAENVDEMIERMKYDLLYIENCSLALDVKIILYTFVVLFQGRGK